MNELKLVAACLSGNAVAQRKLYQDYIQAMFNTATRMLGQRELAEDATQEAFIQVFSQLHTFRGQSSLGSWIKRIVINCCLNILRQNKAFSYVELSTDQFSQYEEQNSFELKFSAQKIHSYIKTLPEGARVVLTLHLIEGFQHKEIAQILNISESTSKSQYSRAKKILRMRLNSKDTSNTYSKYHGN